jgi:predicted DNA-binding WGR domain protein
MTVSTTSAPSTPATRRFEFVGGNSAKFWQVTVAGSSVTVRFGRLGTEGQTLTKEFPSAEAATGHTQRLIAQKSAKGYQEVSAV